MLWERVNELLKKKKKKKICVGNKTQKICNKIEEARSFEWKKKLIMPG